MNAHRRCTLLRTRTHSIGAPPACAGLVEAGAFAAREVDGAHRAREPLLQDAALEQVPAHLATVVLRWWRVCSSPSEVQGSQGGYPIISALLFHTLSTRKDLQKLMNYRATL